MSNTKVGILVGTGAIAGVALYVANRRGRNRSILARTRRQAELLKDRASNLKDRASKLTESAADFMGKSRDEVERQKKGVFQAIEAGKAAYHRMAG
jgi:BMFP domain-containing protein YqiC